MMKFSIFCLAYFMLLERLGAAICQLTAQFRLRYFSVFLNLVMEITLILSVILKIDIFLYPVIKSIFIKS